MKKLAMIFPGQGSQSLGMLEDLALQYDIVNKTFDEASSILDYDVKQLIQEGPVETINQTEFTQPLLLAASIAVWRVWLQENGTMPTYLAGHSLGEYSALVCAQSISFSQALLLVKRRGEVMQEAVPEDVGAMAAIIGLNDDVVRTCCTEVAENEVVEAVNFNAPGQVVVSGHVAAVERAMARAKEKGARLAMKLPVSIPSHCSLMKSAAQQFKTALENTSIAEPQIPVIQNVDVKAHTKPEEIRENLLKQLYSPVRWAETISWMGQQGITTFYECGPGKILCGLNRRILSNSACDSLEIPDNMKTAVLDSENRS